MAEGDHEAAGSLRHRRASTTNASGGGFPPSYQSLQGGELPGNSPGRGPRRRRTGPKQAPLAAHQAGSRGNHKANMKSAAVAKAEPKPAPRKRRKRETKEELATLYAQFFDRIPVGATPEQMAQEFADKELRVILSQNGVLINDYNQASGRYTERTKIQKIEAILSMVNKGCLIPPMRLDEVRPRQKLSRVSSSVGSSDPSTQQEHIAAVRNNHVFQQLHDAGAEAAAAEEEEDEAAEDSSSDEMAPTTPATDVGDEEQDVTATETDVLALLSSLASNGNLAGLMSQGGDDHETTTTDTEAGADPKVSHVTSSGMPIASLLSAL